MLSVMAAGCAGISQRPDKVAVPADTPKTVRSTHPPDAAASYHFMLGYQAEMAQNTDRAIEEYHAALKTDPASQIVKARLAGLYFSLGDMPNAVRYADQAAEGPSQDSQLITQLAAILASAGQGDRAVKLLDQAIEFDPTAADPYFTKGLLLMNMKRQPEAEQAIRERLSVAFPEHAVYGEEYGKSGEAGHLWLIDPIDGTRSFIRGLPFWSVQIALMIDGELVLGVSSAPAFGERAWAVRGQGAFITCRRGLWPRPERAANPSAPESLPRT